ncbi:MAG: hypothetical protein ACI9R3_005496, partial [Verrucomicrobiales bacterium]
MTFGLEMVPDDNQFHLVDTYSLREYPCGLVAGESLRIKQEIRCKDHNGRETGRVYPVGETWIVLSGVKDEPEVIWIRQQDGRRHTW